MYIKNISIKNFKTFSESDIELSKFNVLIGANAAGKSNFISVLKFLRDIIENDLENAISIQGGIEFISNLKTSEPKPLFIQLTVDSTEDPIEFRFQNKKMLEQNHRVEFSIKGWQYELTVDFIKKSSSYKVRSEIIIANGDIIDVTNSKNTKPDKKKITNQDIKIIIESGNVEYIFPDDIVWLKEELITPLFSRNKNVKERISNKDSYFNSPSSMRLMPLSLAIQRFILDISIYDIDPRLLKKSRSMSGKRQLEADGSNLAIILTNLQKNRKKREKYLQLVQDFLPFISSFDVLPLEDNSVITSLNETYNPKKTIPASLISDGTLNITALIIPLVFEKKPLIIIEEPERNIHPSLSNKLVELMKDVTQRFKKQIIITTHNPEIVRNTGIDNLLLVTRDKNGFSTIDKPKENSQIKAFLENNMGLGELYVNNLLEWEK